MPEDLEDKLIDFELMLEGILASSENIKEQMKTRCLEYWYSLSDEIKNKIDKD